MIVSSVLTCTYYFQSESPLQIIRICRNLLLWHWLLIFLQEVDSANKCSVVHISWCGIPDICLAKKSHLSATVLLLGQEQSYMLYWPIVLSPSLPSSCHMVPAEAFRKEIVGLSLLNLSLSCEVKMEAFQLLAHWVWLYEFTVIILCLNNVVVVLYTRKDGGPGMH